MRILCLVAAVLTALPLAVTAATEQIYGAFLDEDRAKTFFHGHSYTANPLACAVALASLELFRSEGALARVQALERHLRARLEPLRENSIVGDVRVIGGVGAIELVHDKANRLAAGYLDHIGPQLAEAFLKRGLFLRPLGNILYFMPPYVITDDQADWALDLIEDVLTDAARSASARLSRL